MTDTAPEKPSPEEVATALKYLELLIMDVKDKGVAVGWYSNGEGVRDLLGYVKESMGLELEGNESRTDRAKLMVVFRALGFRNLREVCRYNDETSIQDMLTLLRTSIKRLRKTMS